MGIPHGAAAMKISVFVLAIFFCITIKHAAGQDIKELLEEFVQSDGNPCGKGKIPTKCICSDKTEVTPCPSHSNYDACGKEIPDCTCENGKKFDPPPECERCCWSKMIKY